MFCAQAHWVGSKPIGLRKVMQLKLHKPTMAIGYSQNVESTNPGRSNLVFRSKPVAEAEISNRLIRPIQEFPWVNIGNYVALKFLVISGPI